MNDDFLYKFRKPPRREFAAALYQSISNGASQPMKTRSRTRILRAGALACAMVAIIAAVLFFSPSTRAFAQSIIRQFGGYIFVEGTTPPDPLQEKAKHDLNDGRVKVSPEQEATLTAEKMQMKEPPEASVKPAGPAGQLPGGYAPDAAAASRLTGFTVLTPAYVPAGYTPVEEKGLAGGWEVAHENGGVAARTRYENPTDKGYLVIEELKYEQGQPNTVERPQIVDVTVRGQSGVWMPDDGGKSTLVWDENGITYLVVGSQLSLDEALKIAESLTQ